MATDTQLNVRLETGEIVALLQIINIAVKANGMQVAEAAVILSKKLQAVLPKEGQDGNQVSGPTGPSETGPTVYEPAAGSAGTSGS
jgi:hypothetical protein